MALVLTLNGVDVTAYLGQPSLTVKFNSMDFTLIDPDAATKATLQNIILTPSLMTPGTYPVTLNASGWSGWVTAFRAYDLVDIASGHSAWQISAINQTPLMLGQIGTSLSDAPAAVLDDYLLEDGSGHYMLEAGTYSAPGALQLEGGSFGYRNLSIAPQYNTDGTTTLMGELTCFQPLWPGAQFQLITSNLAGPRFYVATQVAITWPVPNQEMYVVTFGSTISDQPQTNAQYIKHAAA